MAGSRGSTCHVGTHELEERTALQVAVSSFRDVLIRCKAGVGGHSLFLVTGKSAFSRGSSRRRVRAAGRAQGSNPDRELQTRPPGHQARAEPLSVGQGSGDHPPPRGQAALGTLRSGVGEWVCCARGRKARPCLESPLEMGPLTWKAAEGIPEAQGTGPAPRLPGAPMAASGKRPGSQSSHTQDQAPSGPCPSLQHPAESEERLPAAGQCGAWPCVGTRLV